MGGTVPLLATTRTGSPIIYGSLLVGWGFIPIEAREMRFASAEQHLNLETFESSGLGWKLLLSAV